MRQWLKVSCTIHNDDSCKCGDPDQWPIATTLVTIAGSAGGLDGLRRILSALPANLDAAVAAMLHAGAGSMLAQTLTRYSRLRVREVASGDFLRNGCVHVPRPCTHLVVNPDSRLSVSGAEAGLFRPSADWLFESAAASYRERHVAVVLSGMLFDGSRQLRAVKKLGGTILVQSPADAQYPDMPKAAIATRLVDRVVAIDGMAAAICEAVDRCRREHHVSVWEAPFDPGIKPAFS